MTAGFRRLGGMAINAVEAVAPGRWRPVIGQARRAAEIPYVPVMPPVPMRALPARRGLPHKVLNRLERRVRPPAGPVADDEVVLRVQGSLRRVRVREAVSGADAVRANRDLVVALCEDRGIDYFVVPEPNASRHRIGIPESSWPGLLAALEEVAQSRPLYAAVKARSIRGATCRWSGSVASPDIRAAIRTQPVIEVFEMLAPDRGGPVYGRPYGCLVERWDEVPDDGLMSAYPNERSTLVSGGHRRPVRQVDDGREVTTLAAFTARAMFDIDFPIDAVYMWVDGGDPRWRQRKAAALAAAGLPVPPLGAAEERFRDNGELRYSLRSIEQFAPWLRRIYLVTDDQVPDWLDPAHPRLQVVDHREIFGDQGTLPSFNSHAIGARLHHIAGLSEHYLHFNDDSFLGRPVGPQLFFESNGVSRFFLSRSTLPFYPAEVAAPHEQARRNVADLLQRDFDRLPGRVFFHVPIPQRRSVLTELEARYPAELAATWANQFRSSTDYEVNSWLHHYYGYLTGAAMPGSIRYSYFDLGDPTAWARMDKLLVRRDVDTFCINDTPTATSEQHARMGRWLEAYFSRPSAFERPG